MHRPHAIVLDMDGTIADLYHVPNWLAMLESENAAPYTIAKPIGSAKRINAMLEVLQAEGVGVQVVSWGAKGASKAYAKQVRRAKRAWVRHHLPAIKSVRVIPYGSNKWRASAYKSAVLLDDSPEVCARWNKCSNRGQALQVGEGVTVEGYLTDLVASMLADR